MHFRATNKSRKLKKIKLTCLSQSTVCLFLGFFNIVIKSCQSQNILNYSAGFYERTSLVAGSFNYHV